MYLVAACRIVLEWLLVSITLFGLNIVLRHQWPSKPYTASCRHTLRCKARCGLSFTVCDLGHTICCNTLFNVKYLRQKFYCLCAGLYFPKLNLPEHDPRTVCCLTGTTYSGCRCATFALLKGTKPASLCWDDQSGQDADRGSTRHIRVALGGCVGISIRISYEIYLLSGCAFS